jgi:two-component system chemotaxis sensor kinase CheA
MDDIIREFLTETTENMTEMDNLLVSLEQKPDDTELITQIFRILHTIKGTCGFIGLSRLEKLAHKSEDLLGLFREGTAQPTSESVSVIFRATDVIKTIITSLENDGTEGQGDDTDILTLLEVMAGGETAGNAAVEALADMSGEFSGQDQILAPLQGEEIALDSVSGIRQALTTVAGGASGEGASHDDGGAGVQSLRVNVDVLENLMTMVSELVLTRNQLLQISRQNRDNDYAGPLQRLNLVVSDLQEGVMKTRMQPVGNAWAKLPRIVRDICCELDKKIDLEMHGQETELDRQVLEMIKDPLTHMIRNSADHGIERSEDRIAAGKPETGKIILRSYHQGGYIMIEISDDGRGLQTERIKKKILQNGLLGAQELESLSLQQIQQYVFHAGFSTADKVTSVSGRGVGMDVVRSNIERIGGSIEMRSVEGAGTNFTIKIPLTLAIVSALIIGVGHERFAIPQLSVSELVLVSEKGDNRIEHVNNAQVLRLRGNLLPLIDLRQFMGLPAQAQNDDARLIVVTKVAQFMFGIVVDKVYDLEEIVVKPVPRLLKSLPLFSGNTILGDGKVIMILDPPGILRMSGIMDVTDSARAKDAEETAAKAQGEELPLLLFRSGSRNLKAVPLQMVSRLEKIDVAELELSDGQSVIQYQGQLMPVTSLDAMPDRGVHPLIILRNGPQMSGIIVREIIDIARHYGEMQRCRNADVLGAVILNGEATDIINAEWYTQSGMNVSAGDQHFRMAAE